MQMKLVLAEKPSAAQSFAKVLGAIKREDGYLEGNGYLVSWCVGHLVELSSPESYDERYAKWKYADLPIFPEQWKYQVSSSTRKQFGVLKKLMARADVDSLICATDRERAKRTLFPKKKSQRELLCDAIDTLLATKPKSFHELTEQLVQVGYEFKDGKYPAFRKQGEKRFLRLRSLGEGYSYEELQAVLKSKTVHRSRGSRDNGTAPMQREFNLLIDIQAKMAEGKSAGYERWAKKYNRKEAAKTVCLLKEKGVNSYDELVALTEKLSARFGELSDSIKAAEKRMVEIGALQTHINNYAKTRAVYEAYRKAGYSKKFFEEHREEIQLHKAAKQAFDQLLGKKIPSRKSLHEEFHQLLTEKKKAYVEYRQVKKEMQEYLVAKQNVEHILGICQKEKQHQREVSSTR